MSDPCHDIARILGGMQTGGGFATHFTLPADDLHLETRELGHIPLPVDAFVARELCNSAQLARHGYKDQTRLDTTVRNTWEIPAEQIHIDTGRWQRTFEPALARIREDLGVPADCALRAELHNLLIYEAGQFFAPHQDTEKSDGMVGTLVVGLPSAYTGGRFVIDHQGQTLRTGGSAKKLTFTAFYADCHHEATPVKAGYRIVLTWNLIADRREVPAQPAERDPASDELVVAIRQFFKRPGVPLYQGGRPGPIPDRLVYLLDHQYTQRGLDWQRLKGADAPRVNALKAAAQRLDCDLILAQADVHETWSCEDIGYGRHDRYWDDEDDEDEDEESDGRYRLTDLVDDEVELRNGIAPDGSPADVMGAMVEHGELCLTRPSKDFEPFQTEHEGYMGNYGDTMDRWYHRAAVVMWPRGRAFTIRGKASPEWALLQIADCLDAGDAAQAQVLATRLLPFWSNVGQRLASPNTTEATVAVAAGLDDADTAAALLAPLRLSATTVSTVRHLSALLHRHGRDWFERVLGHWNQKRSGVFENQTDDLQWLAAVLPTLCQAWCDTDPVDGRALAEKVLAERWQWLRNEARSSVQAAHPRELPKLIAGLSTPLLAVVKVSLVVGCADVHDQVMALLVPDGDGLAVDVAIGVLRVAHGAHATSSLRRLGLEALHGNVTREIERLLARPERAPDDWSIDTPLGCACELCATLGTFLRSRTNVRKEWPLAEAKRKHIHGVIDARDLPVSHTTLRTGSPYRLILEKSKALFQRSQRERKHRNGELTWLRSVADAFATQPQS